MMMYYDSNDNFYVIHKKYAFMINKNEIQSIIL